MIVKWPKVVRPGGVAEQYVIVEDFFPTILEMAGVKSSKTVQAVDGKSFLRIMKDPGYRDESRTLIWHFPNKWQPDGPGINYKSAIRKGDWKLIHHMRGNKLELFNLKDDLGEQKDLASQNPSKVKELSRVLSSQLQKWNAPMPVIKSTGERVKFSDQDQ